MVKSDSVLYSDRIWYVTTKVHIVDDNMSYAIAKTPLVYLQHAYAKELRMVWDVETVSI